MSDEATRELTEWMPDRPLDLSGCKCYCTRVK